MFSAIRSSVHSTFEESLEQCLLQLIESSVVAPQFWLPDYRKAKWHLKYVGYLLLELFFPEIVGFDEQIQYGAPWCGLDLALILFLGGHLRLQHRLRFRDSVGPWKDIIREYVILCGWGGKIGLSYLFLSLGRVDEWIIEGVFELYNSFGGEKFVVFLFEQQFLIHCKFNRLNYSQRCWTKSKLYE